MFVASSVHSYYALVQFLHKKVFLLKNTFFSLGKHKLLMKKDQYVVNNS